VKQKLEDKIIQIAPWMFRYPGWDDPQKSLIGFGFECNDGWFDLLKRLIEDFAEIDTSKEIKVQQIKEKFGSLRCYADYPSRLDTSRLTGLGVMERIEQAEKESAKTCEVCGAEGKIISKGGWLMCRCQKCIK
jgi:hypothetical protein